MEFDAQRALTAGIALAGLVLLWANGWRALICWRPGSARFEVEDGTPDVPIPGWLEPTHEALRALEFVPVGSFIEARRFGPTRTAWAYVHPKERTFAVVADSPLVRHHGLLTPPEPRIEREGPSARVTYVSTDGTHHLLSSNFRRPGTSTPGQQCAGLPGAAVDRLFRAHQRRIAELGQPTSNLTLEALLLILGRWRDGPGAPELRRQHAVGLLWTLGGLGMVIASVVGLIRGST